MMEQPDKLFHDKLKDFSKPAPVNGWSRIESNLEPNRFVWMKIAATVLLLISCGAILYFSLSSPGDTEVIAEKTAPSVPPVIIVDSTKNNPIAPQLKDEALAPLPQIAHSSSKETSKRRKSEKSTETSLAPNSIEESQEAQETIVFPPATLDVPEIISPQQLASAELPSQPSAAPSHEDRTITIVLSSEETKHYLKKPDSDATPEDKKSSTLKRVLKKASDLKTNQDPIGDLRQMKNELLALNLKSEKQRGQNK